MEQFNASKEWGTKKQISALENPISEFNARGGLDLNEYRALEEHLATEHPNLGEEQWAEIQKQLPTFELIEDPKSGQKLRIQRFNWPEDGDVSEQTVTFSNMPFSVPIDVKHIQYQHYLIAKELGTPFVVFENPAYGESDKLSKLQKIGLKKFGDFGPIAESMLRIASQLGTHKANFMGYSMGAETAAAMAANASEHGIEVENLFVMEGPGIQVHKPLKLARDFMSDANNLKFTWANPVDPVMREISSLKPSLPRGTLSYGRAMIRGTQEDSLRRALETQPSMHLTIASAGASKISPSNANNDLSSRLHSDYPERYIRRIVIPGEGHAYGDSGQRYANLGRLVLG
jgi:pimeloyl-ACP methyl ester carboxylesterase